MLIILNFLNSIVCRIKRPRGPHAARGPHV